MEGNRILESQYPDESPPDPTFAQWWKMGILRFPERRSKSEWFFWGARLFFVLWLVLMMLVLLGQVFMAPPRDRVTAISIWVCALCIALFWRYRDEIARAGLKWQAPARRKFLWRGSLCAVWVETLFWFVERRFKVEGIAASKNLIVDLLVTMAWYYPMLWLVWKVLNTHTYSWGQIFLMGGIYETGADGLFATIIKGRMSFAVLPQVVLLLPLFCVTYSVIILPAAYMAKGEIDMAKPKPARWARKWATGLLPLAGLVVVIGLAVLVILTNPK